MDDDQTGGYVKLSCLDSSIFKEETMKRFILTYRYVVFGLLVAIVLGGCADSGRATATTVAQRALSAVFMIGGAASAVGLSIIGVKIVFGNASNSGYNTSQGIMALVGAGVGLVLMLAGPSIASAVITSLADINASIPMPEPAGSGGSTNALPTDASPTVLPPGQ
jgi:hypothetical protein